VSWNLDYNIEGIVAEILFFLEKIEALRIRSG